MVLGRERGIPGADPETRFYGDQYEHGVDGSAKISDFVDAVKDGQIDLNQNANINLYGCNTDKWPKSFLKRLLMLVGEM